LLKKRGKKMMDLEFENEIKNLYLELQNTDLTENREVDKFMELVQSSKFCERIKALGWLARAREKIGELGYLYEILASNGELANWEHFQEKIKVKNPCKLSLFWDGVVAAYKELKKQ
jgi:hypothetical protein